MSASWWPKGHPYYTSYLQAIHDEAVQATLEAVAKRLADEGIIVTSRWLGLEEK